jgi:hypothetical protein
LRSFGSARTLALPGGNRRFLAPDGRLGFHQGRLPDVLPERMGPMMLQAYYRSGVPAAFIARVPNTPPEPLWFPTRDKLRDPGIITGAPPPDLQVADAEPSAEWMDAIKQMRWASDDALVQFVTASADLPEQLRGIGPDIYWVCMHNDPYYLETQVRHETLDALAAASRRARGRPRSGTARRCPADMDENPPNPRPVARIGRGRQIDARLAWVHQRPICRIYRTQTSRVVRGLRIGCGKGVYHRADRRSRARRLDHDDSARVNFNPQ